MGRRSELNEIARAMVAPGKGLLAADESSGTIKKRFDSIDVESTEENRRDYREMLFRAAARPTTSSGVILFDETIRQNAADGTPFVELLEKQGVIPGIKVDAGAKPLAFSEGETVTEGLDGLRERLAEYYALGARFAKWRATYSIDTASKGARRPTEYCLDVNAHALARYAALCQEAGIVPIVEPEILMDGDHTIDESFAVTTRVLREVFRQLAAQQVILEGMILKPNMVLVGLRRRRAGVGRGGRRPHGAVLPAHRARRGARDHVPVGRPERRARHRPPRRHEQARSAPVAAELLVRAGAAGPGAEGVERRGRPGRRRPSCVSQPRPPQRRGGAPAPTRRRWKPPDSSHPAARAGSSASQQEFSGSGVLWASCLIAGSTPPTAPGSSTKTNAKFARLPRGIDASSLNLDGEWRDYFGLEIEITGAFTVALNAEHTKLLRAWREDPEPTTELELSLPDIARD